jgi:hypothetical protein
MDVFFTSFMSHKKTAGPNENAGRDTSTVKLVVVAVNSPWEKVYPVPATEMVSTAHQEYRSMASPVWKHTVY